MEDVKIAIRKIKELEFSYQEPSEELKSKFKRDLMRIGVNLHFDMREKEEMFGVIVSITYEYIKSGQIISIMKFRNVTEFHILNLRNVFKRITADKFHMPDNLMATLVGVSVSSARGMIASKTTGSFISQFHLPILSPMDLLKNHSINIDDKIAKAIRPAQRMIARPSKQITATARKK